MFLSSRRPHLNSPNPKRPQHSFITGLRHTLWIHCASRGYHLKAALGAFKGKTLLESWLKLQWSLTLSCSWWGGLSAIPGLFKDPSSLPTFRLDSCHWEVPVSISPWRSLHLVRTSQGLFDYGAHPWSHRNFRQRRHTKIHCYWWLQHLGIAMPHDMTWPTKIFNCDPMTAPWLPGPQLVTGDFPTTYRPSGTGSVGALFLGEFSLGIALDLQKIGMVHAKIQPTWL